MNVLEIINGDRVLNEYNSQERSIDNFQTLSSIIDEAIMLAAEEVATRQVKACADAINSCELVSPNVKRIRLYEALGACYGSNIFNGEDNE